MSVIGRGKLNFNINVTIILKKIALKMFSDCAGHKMAELGDG